MFRSARFSSSLPQAKAFYHRMIKRTSEIGYIQAIYLYMYMYVYIRTHVRVCIRMHKKQFSGKILHKNRGGITSFYRGRRGVVVPSWSKYRSGYQLERVRVSLTFLPLLRICRFSSCWFLGLVAGIRARLTFFLLFFSRTYRCSPGQRDR